MNPRLLGHSLLIVCAAAQNAPAARAAEGGSDIASEVEAGDGGFLARLRIKAESGDAGSEVNLGTVYRDGRGVPRDYDEAVRWYRRAAAQGDSTAQDTLGAMYWSGWGVSKDVAEAVQWYGKAADKGDAVAEDALGGILSAGDGVPKDNVGAVKWFRKAANQGNADAQHSLGLKYLFGDGVPKDEIEGLAWIYVAAGSGEEFAIRQVDRIEDRLGRDASLAAQQRSKEIVKQIEASKPSAG